MGTYNSMVKSELSLYGERLIEPSEQREFYRVGLVGDARLARGRHAQPDERAGFRQWLTDPAAGSVAWRLEFAEVGYSATAEQTRCLAFERPTIRLDGRLQLLYIWIK